MKLHDIWEHFSEIFEKCSAFDRAVLLRIVDPKTTELLARPSGFAEAVLWLYHDSETFRECFDYEDGIPEGILDNLNGNEAALAAQLISRMVGTSFDGTGSIMMHDDEFYAGYMKVKSDWGFDLFVFEDRDGDNDITIANSVIDEIMSTATNEYIAAKECVYFLMGWVFYKDKGEDAFKMDDDDEADVEFASISRMQNYILQYKINGDASLNQLNEDAPPSPWAMAVGGGITLAVAIAVVVREYKKLKAKAEKSGAKVDRKKLLLMALSAAANKIQSARS